jgi:hypothetical protein
MDELREILGSIRERYELVLLFYLVIHTLVNLSRTPFWQALFG